MVQLVIAQLVDAQAQHPALELTLAPTGDLLVRGPIGFCIDHHGQTVEDTYEIELHIPDDYPNSPPYVFETGGKVLDDYEHFMEAGNLCLGAPVEVRRRFAPHKTLLGFVDEQVIPYLFTYSYKRDYGAPPFGELNHGSLGLIEYYMTHFGTKIVDTLKLLKCLADNFAPPLGPCACGSGRRLQHCHGSQLDELRPYYSPKLFEVELRGMIELVRHADIRLPEHDVLPKKMWKQKQSRLRKQQRPKRRRR